jgi:hypothetical protein
MFGKNVVPYAPIGPADVVVHNATAAGGIAAYHVGMAGGTFLSSVKVGDLVVVTPHGTPKSAYVTAIVSDTDLVTDEDLAISGLVFDILRPSEFVIRPPEGIEWVVRSVSTVNGDENWRVGLWFSDGTRKSLIIDTKQLYLRLALTTGKNGLWLSDQQYVVGNDTMLIIRNCTEVTCDVKVHGVNKTMDAIQS